MSGRPDAAVADPPAGTVLHLAAQDFKFGRGCATGEPTAVVVTRLRHDLAHCYDGKLVWVEGHALQCRPDHRPCRQVLVRSAALPPAAQPSPRRDQL